MEGTKGGRENMYRERKDCKGSDCVEGKVRTGEGKEEVKENREKREGKKQRIY